MATFRDNVSSARRALVGGPRNKRERSYFTGSTRFALYTLTLTDPYELVVTSMINNERIELLPSNYRITTVGNKKVLHFLVNGLRDVQVRAVDVKDESITLLHKSGPFDVYSKHPGEAKARNEAKAASSSESNPDPKRPRVSSSASSATSAATTQPDVAAPGPSTIPESAESDSETESGPVVTSSSSESAATPDYQSATTPPTLSEGLKVQDSKTSAPSVLSAEDPTWSTPYSSAAACAESPPLYSSAAALPTVNPLRESLGSLPLLLSFPDTTGATNFDNRDDVDWLLEALPRELDAELLRLLNTDDVDHEIGNLANVQDVVVDDLDELLLDGLVGDLEGEFSEFP